MTAEIVEKLRSHRPEFEALGVAHLRLFGSVARGTADEQSDVDILAVFRPGARPGLKVVRLRRRLEDILGRDVDLLRAPISQPALRAAIDREGVDAF